MTTEKLEPNHTIVGLPNNISSPAIDKISAALAKAQGEILDVYKENTGKVEGTSKTTGKHYSYDYKYAGLDAVMDSIRVAAASNNLSLIMRPNGNQLHTVLSHSSGQWIDYGSYPLGNAEKHQERGGAISYARRYVICCIYGVAPAADEDDGKGGNESLGRKPTHPEPHSKPEYRPIDPVRPGKDKYVIAAPIKTDGSLDFDAFTAELEDSIGSSSNVNEVSMWNRANAKTLKQMQTERPDLFDAIGAKFREMSAALQ